MILEETYSLCQLVLEYNKRKIKLYFNNSVLIGYFYNGALKGELKPLSSTRLFEFMNKHRGFKTKGYNRPSMCFKTFDTKTGKESEEN